MTDDEPYLIKRYSNRKLYDSVRRRFTTLDEIAALLDSGVRVLVRDHDVGTDRTDEVLAQVLRRQVKSQPRSPNFLADLLRAPADVAQTVVTGIQKQSADDDSGPAKEPKAKPAAKKSGAKGHAEKGRGEKDPAAKAKKKAKEAADDGDRRDEEIRELREQVSQLTEAVTLLLKDKTENAD